MTTSSPELNTFCFMNVVVKDNRRTHIQTIGRVYEHHGIREMDVYIRDFVGDVGFFQESIRRGELVVELNGVSVKPLSFTPYPCTTREVVIECDMPADFRDQLKRRREESGA